MNGVIRSPLAALRTATVGALAAALCGCGSSGGMGATTGAAGGGGTIPDGGTRDVPTGAGGNGASGGRTGTAGSGASTGSGGNGNGGSTNLDGSMPVDGSAGDAPTCGLAGLPCCYSQSCSDPNTVCDEYGYVCTACGGPGQLCCWNNSPKCASPTVCHSTGQNSECLCTAASCPTGCGGLGQPCCSTTSACGSGLICGGSVGDTVCLPCGGVGQPCCAGDACAANGCCFLNHCVSNGEACRISSGGYGTCSGGICGCGKLGQPCCPTSNSASPDSVGTCSDASTICKFNGLGNPTACVHCGDAGEPCCPSLTSACSGTNVCDETDDVNPICLPCGPTGNPCCAGNKCSDKAACCSMDPGVSSGRCVAVGASCTTLGMGAAGVCTGEGTGYACHVCGVELGPCCPGPSGPGCSSPLTCLSGGCVMM